MKNDVQAMNQMANGVDFGKVDKEQAREYVAKQLEQNGRTPYQIDQVLSNFDRIYDSKYGKWKEDKATDLISKGQAAAQKGDWDTAQNYFMAADQYDPRRAAINNNGLQQSYNRKMQAQQQRDKEFMAGYMRDENGNLVINPNHPVWQSRKYASAGGGGTGGGRGRRATVDENGNPISTSKGTKKNQADAEGMLQKSIDWYQKEYDAAKKSLDAIDPETNPLEYQSMQEDVMKLQQNLKQEKNKLFYLRDGAAFHDSHWMGGVNEDGEYIPGSFANTDGGEIDDDTNISDQNQADADAMSNNRAYAPQVKRGGGWVSGNATTGNIFSDEYWREKDKENRRK